VQLTAPAPAATVPAAHAAQDGDPARASAKPAVQLAHALEPSELKEPTPQRLQAAAPAWLKEPAAQESQDVAPLSATRLPASQGSQIVLFVALHDTATRFPGWQTEHVSANACPPTLW